MNGVAAYTPPGMAHWANTYPEGGKTCGDCRFLGSDQRCGKYKLLTGKKGEPLGKQRAAEAIPACKYFKERASHK